MATPKNFHDIPNPDPSIAGRNLPDTGNSPYSPENQAHKYKPPGAVGEPDVATIARLATHLIDRTNGKAYSADELPGAVPTNATINTAIEDNASASRDALGLGTAAVEDVSTAGGIGKVPKTDTSGALKLGPTNAVAAWQPTGGELIVPAWQRIAFEGLDGVQRGFIYNFAGHSGGDELLVQSPRLCAYFDTVMQLGSALGGPHGIFLSSGTASAGATNRASVPIHMNAQIWNSSAAVENRVAFQARNIDSSGTNAEWIMNQNVTNLGASQDINGTPMIRVSGAGVWSNGTAPAFDVLTDGATITQTASIFKTTQAATVTLGGNRTLAISGAAAGMRGVIYVTQDATGSRTLTPSGGSALDLSTTANATDRVTWEFDGIFYNFSVQKDVQREVVISDSDAAAFIAAAAITNNIQKAAISNMVTGFKASNVSGTGTLWSKFYAIYPFVGGGATPHSKDLKLTYNGSFVGSPTHDANGITGDGVGAYLNTGFALSAVSAINSVFAHVHCKTSSPTDTRYLFGATAVDNARLGLYRTGSSIGKVGLNANDLSGAYGVSSAFDKHFFQNRSASNAQQFGDSVSYSSDTVASLSACSQPIYILARNQKGTADNYTNANLAFAAFGQSLDVAERAAYFALVTAFQTALGR